MLAYSIVRPIHNAPKAVRNTLVVARLSAGERTALQAACARAGVEPTFESDVAQARRRLVQVVEPIRTVIIDPDLEGAERLIAWIRSDLGLMRTIVIALVAQPTEGAYQHAHAIGADDVALRSDLGTATRRLAATASNDEPTEAEAWRGRACVVHPNGLRRRLLGRVLRQAGFEVAFATSEDEVRRVVEEAPERIELLVVAQPLLDETPDLISRVREAASGESLPAVVLRNADDSERAGETIGHVGIVADDAAADALLFVVNELFAGKTTELRASPRLLFSTLCAFRREHELSPSYGLTYNVSRRGLFVRTLDPPAAGSPIWFELRPPGRTGVVHLRGEVMWAREAGAKSDALAPPGFGVRLLEAQCPPGDLASYWHAYQAFRDAPRSYRIGEGGNLEPSPRDRISAVPDSEGRILVADDDDRLTRVYRRVLEQQGYEVTLARSGQEALAMFNRGRFDAVITDLEMPEPKGLELLRRIRKHDETVPVIIATGAPSTETAIEALEHGAFRYLTKPFDRVDLLEIVQRAVSVGRLTRLQRKLLDVHASELAPANEIELEEVFKRALDQLYLVYQPIVSVSRRETYAHEVLVRSHDPALPHPGALFGAAETLGRLQHLSRAIRTLAPEPMAGSGGRLFVNIHPGDLLDCDLYDPDSPLARVADQVTLEITERASLSEIPDLKQRIADLRTIGFSIAVDDLGAGYAGLTSLAQLEPDVAKLDMALVRDIDKSPTKQRLVRSFAQLCAELDIVLITEGVETEAERDALAAVGCDLMQGYLFAKPGLPFPTPSF